MAMRAPQSQFALNPADQAVRREANRRIAYKRWEEEEKAKPDIFEIEYQGNVHSHKIEPWEKGAVSREAVLRNDRLMRDSPAVLQDSFGPKYVGNAGLNISDAGAIGKLLQKNFEPEDRPAALRTLFEFKPSGDPVDAARKMSKGAFLLKDMDLAKVDSEAQAKAGRLTKAFSNIYPGQKMPAYNLDTAKGYNLASSPGNFGLGTRMPTQVGAMLKNPDSMVPVVSQLGEMATTSPEVNDVFTRKYVPKMAGAFSGNDTSFYHPISDNILDRIMYIERQKRRTYKMNAYN